MSTRMSWRRREMERKRKEEMGWNGVERERGQWTREVRNRREFEGRGMRGHPDTGKEWQNGDNNKRASQTNSLECEWQVKTTSLQSQCVVSVLENRNIFSINVPGWSLTIYHIKQLKNEISDWSETEGMLTLDDHSVVFLVVNPDCALDWLWIEELGMPSSIVVQKPKDEERINDHAIPTHERLCFFPTSSSGLDNFPFTRHVLLEWVLVSTISTLTSTYVNYCSEQVVRKPSRSLTSWCAIIRDWIVWVGIEG